VASVLPLAIAPKIYIIDIFIYYLVSMSKIDTQEQMNGTGQNRKITGKQDEIV
jgi:hypothetical protein